VLNSAHNVSHNQPTRSGAKIQLRSLSSAAHRSLKVISLTSSKKLDEVVARLKTQEHWHNNKKGATTLPSKTFLPIY
jgi:hypothetical protein